MPLTDNFGQGVPYSLLSDPPNAQTLGEGIVNGIVPQSIMRFGSTSQRGATLTNPQEGMVTWIQDVNLLQVYDGSTWVTIAIGETSWTNIPLANGYTSEGNEDGVAQYKLMNVSGTPMVIMRGGISITYVGGALPNNGQVTSQPLPAPARPSSTRRMNVACSDLNSSVSALKMGARADGTIWLSQPGGSTPAWLVLNGIMYSL